MQIRTLAIFVVVLLVGAFILRFVVVRFGLLPVSEEVVLRKAAFLTVTYIDGGRSKSLKIKDGAEVREVLATLRIQVTDTSYYDNVWGGPAPGWSAPLGPSVDFWFPDHTNRSYTISSPHVLGNMTVDPAFGRKLREIVSRHEGHPVDIFAQLPGQ
jgi:hypothetical protein